MNDSRRIFLQQSISLLPLLAFPRLAFAGRRNDLPRVLIIGDSISIGYMPFVVEMLKGKARVTRPLKDDGTPENCAGTTNGVKQIERWIGEGEWDLIHFNFGLHDIKRVDPVTGATSKNPEDPHQAGPKQYRKNLEFIVEKLKDSGATIIFATTTPYPDDVKGPIRDPGLHEKYNKVALKIMRKNDIVVDDLHAYALPHLAEWQRPRNVHFTEDGSRELARQVVKVISENLP